MGNLCQQSEPDQNRQNVRPDLDTGEKQISNRADFWKLNCMNWEDREAGYGDRGGGRRAWVEGVRRGDGEWG